jgi:hypothetical protein
VDVYAMAARPRSSYEVLADGLGGDVTPLTLQRIGCSGQPIQVGVPASGGASRSLRWQNTSGTTVGTDRIEVRSGGCDVDCDPEDAYSLRAYETTLFIPRFNNSASQITVLVLENATAAAVAGNAWFHGAGGVLLGSIPFNLAPRGAAAFNTAAVPGAGGQGGSIRISHDGPYGALSGKAVAVEPSTGFTFDSVLSSRPR